MIKLLLGLLLLSGTAYAELKNTDAQFVAPQNLLPNGGGENGKTKWTASGGTFTVNTTAANVAVGKASLAWDASGAQTFRSNAVTIPAGLYGNNCLGKIKYLGGDTNLTLQVLDGSDNVLASQALAVQSVFKTETVSFVCPSSGSFKLGLSAGANAAIVYLDDAYLGENYMVGMASQATLYGSTKFATASNCIWVGTSTSPANFSADSDCASATNTGNATTSTKIPGISFSSLPPGEYFVTVSGHFSAESGNTCEYFLSDGTTTAGYMLLEQTESRYNNVLSANFSYSTAQSAKTFQVQQDRSAGSNACNIENNSANQSFQINVYKFPSTQDQVLRTDQVGWRVDANISGANPSLGTASVSSYTGLTNSALTMVQNTGSIGVQIPCSSTNASSGLTCSAGDESVGVVYNQPSAGPVIACASFSWFATTSTTTNDNVVAVFQVVETPNAAQTISTEGGSRIGGRIFTNNNTTVNGAVPLRVCGVFNFTSAGQKTLRLMYEQQIGGTITVSTVQADADVSTGQRDIHWEVYPIGQYISQPVIVNSVSSNGAGPWRVEAARIDCDGASTIGTQTGTWISSIGNISAGRCTLTFPAGAFSATPLCVAVPEAGGSDDRFLTMDHQSATSVIVGCYDVTGAAACTDYDANIHCMGAR